MRSVGGVLAISAMLTGAPAVAAASPSAADDAPEPQVTIHKAEGGISGPKVANALSDVREGDRGEFTQKAVDAADGNDDNDYNVIIMNLSQDYDSSRLDGVQAYANVKWDNISYGLWIVEGGEFENKGDGGYINWAFQGEFERDGNTVKFH